jgi:hypothetical protein
MDFSRHRLSNPNPDRPAAPDNERNWAKEYSGRTSNPPMHVALRQAFIFTSQHTTFPLAGREHQMSLGGSGAASSHQEVAAPV